MPGVGRAGVGDKWPRTTVVSGIQLPGCLSDAALLSTSLQEIPSYIPPLKDQPTRPLTHPLKHPPNTRHLTHAPTHSLKHPLTRPLNHPLNHPHTHTHTPGRHLTHQLAQNMIFTLL